MKIDRTRVWWSAASNSMVKRVHEGKRLTWRKQYNDTKDKEILLGRGLNIYEVRMAEDYIYETKLCEYMEIRMLGNYQLPWDFDELCADLFDLSLAYKLVAVDVEFLEIVVEESKDGNTNIDETVMEAMMEIQKKVVKQFGKKGGSCASEV